MMSLLMMRAGQGDGGQDEEEVDGEPPGQIQVDEGVVQDMYMTTAARARDTIAENMNANQESIYRRMLPTANEQANRILHSNEMGRREYEDTMGRSVQERRLVGRAHAQYSHITAGMIEGNEPQHNLHNYDNLKRFRHIQFQHLYKRPTGQATGNREVAPLPSMQCLYVNNDYAANVTPKCTSVFESVPIQRQDVDQVDIDRKRYSDATLENLTYPHVINDTKMTVPRSNVTVKKTEDGCETVTHTQLGRVLQKTQRLTPGPHAYMHNNTRNMSITIQPRLQIKCPCRDYETNVIAKVPPVRVSLNLEEDLDGLLKVDVAMYRCKRCYAILV